MLCEYQLATLVRCRIPKSKQAVGTNFKINMRWINESYEESSTSNYFACQQTVSNVRPFSKQMPPLDVVHVKQSQLQQSFSMIFTGVLETGANLPQAQLRWSEPHLKWSFKEIQGLRWTRIGILPKTSEQIAIQWLFTCSILMGVYSFEKKWRAVNKEMTYLHDFCMIDNFNRCDITINLSSWKKKRISKRIPTSLTPLAKFTQRKSSRAAAALPQETRFLKVLKFRKCLSFLKVLILLFGEMSWTRCVPAFSHKQCKTSVMAEKLQFKQTYNNKFCGLLQRALFPYFLKRELVKHETRIQQTLLNVNRCSKWISMRIHVTSSWRRRDGRHQNQIISDYQMKN